MERPPLAKEKAVRGNLLKPPVPAMGLLDQGADLVAGQGHAVEVRQAIAALHLCTSWPREPQSYSKPGIKMVYPEPCEAIERRLHRCMARGLSLTNLHHGL